MQNVDQALYEQRAFSSLQLGIIKKLIETIVNAAAGALVKKAVDKAVADHVAQYHKS